MLNTSSVSFSSSVATILLASGFLLTLEAQQPLTSAPPAPVAAHNTFVSRYCASCHNDRLKRGESDARRSGRAGHRPTSRSVGEGGPKAPRAADAAGRIATAGRGRLQRRDRDARDGARSRGRSLAESGPDRHVPAPDPNRVPERDSRPARARRRCRRRCCRPTKRATASTTSRSAISRRRCSIGTSRRPKRSAVLAVGRPSVSPGGDTIRIPADLTQEEHIDGLPIGTRGGALITTRSRWTANTRSRSG